MPFVGTPCIAVMDREPAMVAARLSSPDIHRKQSLVFAAQEFAFPLWGVHNRRNYRCGENTILKEMIHAKHG